MKKILVVDDEFDIADALTSLLESDGYSARACHSGREALALMAEDPPDLLISDVMMAGMNGLELLRAVRSDPKLASLPVIIMSAALPPGEPTDHRWSAYLQKPFTIHVIFDKIKALIGEP